MLTDRVIPSLSRLIRDNYHLSVLFLRWNHFTPKCAQVLFSALGQNKGLKIIDLSFNSLGGAHVGEMFRNNRTLVHVDLGFTKIKDGDRESIGEGLRQNHSVLGIHIQGNERLGFDTKG